MSLSPEKDMHRFDRALNEINSRGGGVRLLSWPNKNQISIPESSANWGDVSTMLRHFVSESNSRVALRLIPNGRATEEFRAIWKRAERDPFEDESPLSEPAMDALVFDDGTKFFFDVWSEGRPFALVGETIERQSGWIEVATKWILNHFVETIFMVIAAIAAALIIAQIGIG